MSRRTQIMALFAMLFLVQMALLTYWHIESSAPLHIADVAVSGLTLLVTAVVYFISARYYLRSIKHATVLHAAHMSGKLEQSLELYRAMAEREEQVVRHICSEIDSELVQAREELAAGETDEIRAHLQRSLSMASETATPRCQNAVIAAVLDAEARQFTSEGFELITKVDIPAEIGIPDIEIAAMLFNLADEALTNCKALSEQNPSVKPSATIRMLTNAGQLVIEAVSPSYTSPTNTKGGTSRVAPHKSTLDWSARVIEDFARSNGGIIEFFEEGSISRMSVMIPLRDTRGA